MQKKLVMMISVVIIVIVIGGIMYQQLSHTGASLEAEHDGLLIKKSLEPLYKQYDRLDNLEQEAELIIIGEPTKSLRFLMQSETKRENDQIREFWVNTPVRVIQIIKGEYEADEITIPQPYIFFDEENEHVFTPMGYSPLIENAQYVLFLTKSDFGVSGDQEYAWNVMSLNHGKYNLDGRDQIEDLFSDNKQQKLKKKVVKKYIWSLPLIE